MLDTNETVTCTACGERNLAIARRCGSCAAPLGRGALRRPADARGDADGASGDNHSSATQGEPAPVVVGYASRVSFSPRKAAELRRHAVKASGLLIGIAALYAVLAAVSFLVAMWPTSPSTLTGLVIGLACLSGVYVALALWARFQPLAAATAALAFFLLLLALDLLVWMFGSPGPRMPSNASSAAWSARLVLIGLAVLIRVIVAALIVAAIGHGMVRRQVLREQ